MNPVDYTASSELTPPPWQMQGKGWIIAAHWRRGWLLERGWIPANLADRYVGGPGAIMLVDYQHCPIGPYRELLMIPGRFRSPAGIRHSITRITVSTQISIDNGRAHWAIPKTLGDFQIEATARGERWQIAENGAPLARFELRARGPRLPVSTRVLPAALGTLAQPLARTFHESSTAAAGEPPWRDLLPTIDSTYRSSKPSSISSPRTAPRQLSNVLATNTHETCGLDHGWLLTRPSASGQVRLAKLEASWADPERFPEPDGGRVLLSVQVPSFNMQFPLARMLS